MKRPKRHGKRKASCEAVMPPIDVKPLRHLVEGSCKCKGNCFAPFRAALFDRLVSMRERLAHSEKLDGDTYARPSEYMFRVLKSFSGVQPSSGPRTFV